MDATPDHHDRLSQLLQIPSAWLADVGTDDGADVVLVRSNRTGTAQLYEWREDGDLRQLTDLDQPVGAARYVAHQRRAVIEVDHGGDERHQLYLVDLDAASTGGPRTRDQLVALTGDPRFAHQLAGVSADGAVIAFLSNRRNGVDFDCWVRDLATGTERCVYQDGGWCQVSSGFSPDGRWLSILRPGPRPLDVDLLLIDLERGEVRVVLEHPNEAAEVGPPAWIDATSFFVATNVGRDFGAVVRYDLTTGASSVLAGTGEDRDASPITGASRLAVIENDDGAHRLHLVDPASGALVREIALAEVGVVADYVPTPPTFSKDGSRLYFTLSSAGIAGDLWVVEADGSTRRVTVESLVEASSGLVAAETTAITSFDGERVPLFVYRPVHAAAAPVVVLVHGGPEAQAMRSFNPVVQALVEAGYGVVVPNVRGSTGYGKRYAALDDTTRRLDSVADLAAIHDWLAGAGFDPSRAALMGGSYGGYMVLAGLAFQPERWAAGIDIVGISDLVTFLENTSDYRRRHRELEYGSLEHDRDFLAAASPRRHVDAVRAPLFMIHGRNDPRVPLSEAEDMAAHLRARGVRCELIVYDDEGHGLARLANRLDAYPRALAFLDEVVAKRGS